MQRQSTARTWRYGAALGLLVFGYWTLGQAAGEDADATPLSAEAIVNKMQAANLRRAEALHGYTGRRLYKVDYRGFPGSRHAEMVVEAAYSSPDRKEFNVVSQSGSKLLLNRVLFRLLESEKEALQEANRERTALGPQNYSFTLLNTEQTPAGKFYVLQVEPKVNNKFLYRGKIWVDAEDFAVMQIEGEPAKNPSWWISHTQIKHDYTKVGEFWLPAHNQSLTQVRLGGKAVLNIEYTDYEINNEEKLPAPSW
jgi:hypothetical protein